MRVIGTAGHVDHGKSSLVQALTGVHPDRLKEEREREMTIDLGFAYLTLPGGEEVGIIDVPGHRDFIENMLAGVGGIDASLFVVAADEGVMPQTREHLAILDLLRIPQGLVALTKIDLIEDSEWLDLVEEELASILVGTALEAAPVVRVSAKTGTGLPSLIELLDGMLTKSAPRPDLGRPRLPVDRAFSMPGFGTVVTGTLVGGAFELGQEISILPAGTRGRIRGLQAHGRKQQRAMPGSRTAINVSGVDLDKVQRGDWITRPGQYRPTRRLDLEFEQLGNISKPVKHNMEVKIFSGAAEVTGRLRLLGVGELPPGARGWIQLELAAPVVALRGDRYILRRPSPAETLGGGMVLDPHPLGRHKRFDEAVLDRLAALAAGSSDEILLHALLSVGAAPLRAVYKRSTLAEADARGALQTLVAEGELIALEPGELELDGSLMVASRPYWDGLVASSLREVHRYHRQNPLRLGIPKEELKSRLNLETRVYNLLVRWLSKRNQVQTAGALLWLPDHRVRFAPDQQRAIDQLLAAFGANPFAPPSVKEAQAAVGTDVYAAMLDLGDLVQVSPEVVFRRGDFDELAEQTRQIIGAEGGITVAGFRDQFETSRKYALAFLEYLDAEGITERDGDVRRLVTK